MGKQVLHELTMLYFINGTLPTLTMINGQM